MSDIFGLEPPKFAEPTEREIVVTDRDDKPLVVDVNSAAFGLAKNLKAKQDELAELEAANAARLAKQEELRKAKEKLQEQMNEITIALHDIDLELFDYRQNKRRLNNDIFDLRRQLAQAIANEQAAKEMVKNKQKFSKLMQDFSYSDKIMEHQKDGAFVLANNMRVILGDKRGAGKTLTAIASWDMAQSQRVLVIVPDDVVSNFLHEIHYWAPHRNVMPLGKMTPAQRTFAFQMAKQLESFTMVVNYSAWRKDKSLIDSLIDLRFDTVVLDEAHEIKNTSTSAYAGCRAIVLAENQCPKCKAGGIKNDKMINNRFTKKCTVCDWNSANDDNYEFLDRCSVKMVTPMSGTVILNKPQDLFALLSLIDPINFREVADFLRVYCHQNIWTQKWEFKPGGLESLKTKLSGKYIARDGVQTPGQKIYHYDIDIDPELYPNQYRVIEQLSKHAQVMLNSGKKMTILATIALITRKRQANVWPAGIKLRDEDGNIIFDVGDDVRESIKLDRVIQYHPTADVDDAWSGLIPEITENGDKELGSRVLVFSQFKGPLAELEERCKRAGISVVRFDGDTPQHVRDEAKIDFDRKFCDTEEYKAKYEGGYRWQVLLCNYKTGGVGLNFTGATETIILDREWNPGKEDQAFGRTDRMGQTEETKVHVIRINRTIDTWMDALIEQKERLIDGFNEAAVSMQDQLLEALKKGDMI